MLGDYSSRRPRRNRFGRPRPRRYEPPSHRQSAARARSARRRGKRWSHLPVAAVQIEKMPRREPGSPAPWRAIFTASPGRLDARRGLRPGVSTRDIEEPNGAARQAARASEVSEARATASAAGVALQRRSLAARQEVRDARAGGEPRDIVADEESRCRRRASPRPPPPSWHATAMRGRHLPSARLAVSLLVSSCGALFHGRASARNWTRAMLAGPRASRSDHDGGGCRTCGRRASLRSKGITYGAGVSASANPIRTLWLFPGQPTCVLPAAALSPHTQRHQGARQCASSQPRSPPRRTRSRPSPRPARASRARSTPAPWDRTPTR